MPSQEANKSSAPYWRPLVVERAIYEFEPKFSKSESYVPDTIADGWETDNFLLRAACVRGYAHRFSGLPRQDQIGLTAYHDGGEIMIAVADGISEAPHSSVGAALACRYATNWYRTRIEEGEYTDAAEWGEAPWRDLLRNAAWGLIDYAHVNLGEEEDALLAERLLGTTLTVAIITPRSNGSADVHAVQVGDSDIWILRDRRYHAVTPHALMQSNADTVTSTAVIGLPRLPTNLQLTHAEFHSGDVLLVGTDGFGAALGDGSGRIGEIFSSELSTAPPPLRMAYTLDFSRELFDDDRSLVAVWNKRSTDPPVRSQ
ncbi:protein phosphatase 2C domain-containing protein [Streptomyces sp. NPDC058676]|uniref:protein phosphatase 2C domain-containing protein n=1 Tax=unclassified Streptomyces TaxID=2593676 RepID=UPI00364EB43B